MEQNGAEIKAVEPGSIAAKSGLMAGDILEGINGSPVRDLIDYLFLSSDEQLDLEILQKSGSKRIIRIENAAAEPLGIKFAAELFDGIRKCANHCLFCFVHQLPSGQRASLYIQDDDYRLSFLQGSYITLTNLTEADWSRIKSLHLSPLYISVHATEALVREKLLGTKAARPIIKQLRRLARADITMHTQAVLCPHINDGSVLVQTIADLEKLWPAVASLAVVPVGLTKWRRNLFNIETFTREEARSVLAIVQTAQERNLAASGTRFVFAADEWYLLADIPIPAHEAYEDYYQLDNGVGLLRWFEQDFTEVFPRLLPRLKRQQRRMIVITGVAAESLWRKIQAIFAAECPDLKLDILPVMNEFFGPKVTVTGLLTGGDIAKAIREYSAGVCAPISGADVPDSGTNAPHHGSIFMIPGITLRDTGDLFLDGMAISDLRSLCDPEQLAVTPTRAKDWLEWLVAFLESGEN